MVEHSNLHLIDNPDKTVPFAMNIGILNAKGSYVVRIDAHCLYPSNYVSFLIEWSKKLNAANVGMVVESVSLDSSATSKSLIKVLSDRLGVGNSYFRTGISGDYVEVDTVPFGCYPRDLFDRVGLYDTRLTRGQDIEMNRRITRYGGKIYLVSGAKIQYFAADNFSALFRKYFKTGKWVVKVPFFTGSMSSISLRHLIPLGFFLFLAALILLFLVLPKKALIASTLLVVYLIVIIARSVQLSDNIKEVLLAASGFVTLHFAYGAGSFFGLCEVVRNGLLKSFKSK
jgi:glycosyltransferase involved in cell wall biosynthesis